MRLNSSSQLKQNPQKMYCNSLKIPHKNISLAKTSDHVLWKGEIYLANEWFDVALEEFTKYLSAADFRIDQDVTTPPSFHRNLFARIGKIGKDVQDKEGFANMVNELIGVFHR